MIYNGCNFIFNGVPSEKYGLKIVNLDGSSPDDTDFGSNIIIHEDKIRRNPVPYFYGSETAPVLQFPLTICSGNDKPLDIYDRHAIGQWLFGQREYKWLKIIKPDMEHVMFKCFLTEPQNVAIGGVDYAKKFNVRCNAPFAFTDELTSVFNITNANKLIRFHNQSDENDYLYPKLEITLNSGITYISIINQMDNNRKFELTGLRSGETLFVDNQKQIITTASNAKVLSKFNLNWFRLTSGYNVLNINGNSTIKITARFPKKVGG